ncbi:hypothetical protein HDU93_004184, partial [Gonapodya sp. JEL0774]
DFRLQYLLDGTVLEDARDPGILYVVDESGNFVVPFGSEYRIIGDETTETFQCGTDWEVTIVKDIDDPEGMDKSSVIQDSDMFSAADSVTATDISEDSGEGVPTRSTSLLKDSPSDITFTAHEKSIAKEYLAEIHDIWNLIV